jgi:type IV pilus secretin PilQ/predicted competence protein
VNLSHRLSGVCIGILTIALWCGGCSVTRLAGPPPPADSQGASGRATITGITTETLGENVRITVQITEAIEYMAFTLQAPPRLVLTFPGATLGDLPRPLPVAGVVHSIEALQVLEERAVRCVVYLQHMTTHTVELQGRQLLITLADAGTRSAEMLPTAATETAEAGDRAAPVLTSPLGPGPAKLPSAMITAITFDTRADRSLVSFQTAGALPQVQVKQQQNPHRLALDIKPAQLSPTQEKALIVHDLDSIVSHLEVIPLADAQEETVKVVVYLRTAASFDVHQDNDAIRLALQPSSPSPMAASAPATLQSPMVAPLPPLPPAPRPVAPAASLVAATVPRITQISPIVRRGAAPAAVPSPSAASSAPVSQNEGLPSGGSVTEPPAFTGEKISLDFQDADINDILRLLAEVGKVNIIAGGDVQGKITTRMTDVPWDQALDVVLKINGLAQERSGNIIRVAPLEKFTNERQERLKAMVTEVQAEPLVTRIVPANYAAAKDLRPNLEKLLSRRGTIIIDARTNTMIITDTQASLDGVLALIEKLDRPTPQVMIEARIVESSRTFLREMGIQLGLAYSQITDKTFPNRIDVRGGVPPATNTGGLVPPTPPANFLLDLPAAVGLGSGGAIGFSLASIGGAILDAQLSALESSGRGKIISSPKIATLDNTEAQIQSGRKIPVATVSAEGTRTEFVDANITLKVTPHVTPNEFIGMKIIATKNEADFGQQVNGIPTIITREANTDMLVKDGDTVVIGGLYKRTIQSSRSGIPGLSSIPVLGSLFRKESERDDSDELLIFLTPRIIRQDDATDKRRTALSR